MKLLLFAIALFTAAMTVSCGTRTTAQQEEKKPVGTPVELIKNEAGNQVDVMVDGKLFTSLKYVEGVYKPVLFPILTSSGTTITRGFPLEPRTGERPDHRHHVGNWMNYGNVDGYDFWGNGHTGERSPNGGEIKLLGIEKLESCHNEGIMVTKGSWVDPKGKELLAETTEYHFIAKGQVRVIDRITTLTATDKEVSMKDTKEGMFAIRVARQLELPSEGDITLLDAQGNPEKVKAMSNEDITGDYRSSEGVTGGEVWGTRARWMDLFGKIGPEKISILICDHPKNPNYPTFWHARGYGLFSANPLGVRDFTRKKEELNFSVHAGQSVTFRYRMVISSNAHLTDDDNNAFADEFAKKY